MVWKMVRIVQYWKETYNGYHQYKIRGIYGLMIGGHTKSRHWGYKGKTNEGSWQSMRLEITPKIPFSGKPVYYTAW